MIEKWILLRMARRAAIFLISGIAVVWLAAFLTGSARGEETAAGMPAEADDPLNRAIRIEGGTFMMGSDEPDTVPAGSPYSTFDESPPHPKAVAGFWMQEHEVTNEEYRRFDPSHEFAIGHERYPVVNVTFGEATAYAASLGGRLPTESEWEFASRGTASRKYPWGDAEPTCNRAQYGACDPGGTLEVMTRPAGATAEGIQDLAGNVWEWVVPDWYDPPTYPVNDASRRLRGGSFAEASFFLRAANRNNGFLAGFKSVSTGFRVVWPLK
jgi:formylglycine-generating enzyme required for sulfatase activity